MQLPPVRDATVRYLVLTVAGIILIWMVPDSAFGDGPVWEVFGRQGPTAANLIGIALVVAGCAYFTVVVTVFRGLRSRDPLCRAAVMIDWVCLVGFFPAMAACLTSLGVALLCVATAAQLTIAARAGRGPQRPFHLGRSEPRSGHLLR